MKSIKPPFVRSPYNYDMNAAGDESGLKCEDDNLAQQHFKDECDINYIADRFKLTGEMPNVQDLPTWGQSFDTIFNFQDAQNAVIEAKQRFMTLPAKIRTRFNNDPGQLLDFIANQDNRDEAIFLGLIEKPLQDEPQSPRSEPVGEPKGDLPPPDGKPTGDLPPKSKKDKN